MTKLELRAFLFQLAFFTIFFVLFRYLIYKYTIYDGFLGSLGAFIIGTIIAPKFQAVKTKDGEKLFVKILFLKDVKHIG